MTKTPITDLLTLLFESICIPIQTLSSDDEDTLCEALYELDIPLDLECGSTKMVFIPLDKNDPYVYKIPFSGKWTSEGFVPFEISDYCARELQNLNEMSKSGFGKSFASIEHFATLTIGTKIEIYRQPKIDNFLVENFALSMHKKNLIQYLLPLDDESLNVINWWDKCIQTNGLIYTLNFFNKLSQMDLLEDLRPQNLGYTEEGAPTIIDYGGFYE